MHSRRVCVVVVVVVQVNGAFTAVLHNPSNLTVSCNLTHTHTQAPPCSEQVPLFVLQTQDTPRCHGNCSTDMPPDFFCFFFSGLVKVTSTFTCTCDRGGGLERSFPPPPLGRFLSLHPSLSSAAIVFNAAVTDDKVCFNLCVI